MIELKDIRLKYKGVELFDGLSLSIGKGDFSALKGRSGSGKTTLMNLMLGFEQPDSGEVRLFGEKLRSENIHELRKRVAWLPQNVTFFKALNVRHVFDRIFSFNANLSIAPDDSEILDAFSRLGLEADILEQDIEELSGGEKQRALLAVTKLLKRDIILMDEPSSALDKNSVERAAEFIMDSGEQTILSTSHDELWLSKCNKIIEL